MVPSSDEVPVIWPGISLDVAEVDSSLEVKGKLVLVRVEDVTSLVLLSISSLEIVSLVEKRDTVLVSADVVEMLTGEAGDDVGKVEVREVCLELDGTALEDVDRVSGRLEMVLVAKPDEAGLREDTVVRLTLDARLTELYCIGGDIVLDPMLTAGVEELTWSDDVTLRRVDETTVLDGAAALLEPDVEISADVEL